MNPSDKISEHFTWKDALWLPQWNRMATEADGVTEQVIANLKDTFSRLDKLRDFLTAPIIVHVAYRSPEYNKLVRGAAHSTHLEGKACDFHVQGYECDTARQIILNKGLLEQYDMRMEDNGSGASWVHLDTREPAPGHTRFFKP